VKSAWIHAEDGEIVWESSQFSRGPRRLEESPCSLGRSTTLLECNCSVRSSTLRRGCLPTLLVVTMPREGALILYHGIIHGVDDPDGGLGR
jgi:hypothetical protein